MVFMSVDQAMIDASTMNQGKTFVWHEIYAPTTESSIDFYTKALDFGTLDMDMGEMGPYKMLTRNGIPCCGVVSTNEMPNMANVPPHWATFISVDDVDERLKLVEEHGGKLVHGPMDIPTVGRMALIVDPNGAAVWIFRPSR